MRGYIYAFSVIASVFSALLCHFVGQHFAEGYAWLAALWSFCAFAEHGGYFG